MIVQDFIMQQGVSEGPGIAEAAIRNYMVNTLDPVVKSSSLRRDNYFYLLCLQGKYSEK
jgi:betaine lipid synthase